MADLIPFQSMSGEALGGSERYLSHVDLRAAWQQWW